MPFKAWPCAVLIGPRALQHGDSVRQISACNANMHRCTELALVTLHTHQLSHAWMRSERDTGERDAQRDRVAESSLFKRETEHLCVRQPIHVPSLVAGTQTHRMTYRKSAQCWITELMSCMLSFVSSLIP